jgi:two-component system sensor histidine kinase RegB
MKTAVKENLYQLNIIRVVVLGAEFLALIFFTFYFEVILPTNVLSYVLIFYGIVITAVAYRLSQADKISESEFFYHVLIDILFFTGILYCSGGASNPFVSYYLVPICIAAGTLSLRYTIGAALLSLAAYSSLFIDSYNISAFSPENHRGHHAKSNNLHIIGMWCNFLISAIVITFFVTRMAGTLKQQNTAIAKHRENQLRDEQLIGIGALAAGTAHELGTPLNTMKIIVDEIKEGDSSFKKDINILRSQIEQCRMTLRELVATAEISENNKKYEFIKGYMKQLLERWQILHPKMNASITLSEQQEDREVFFDPTIAPSLLNLLNNAAEASPQKVDVKVTWNTEFLEICIRDYGDGDTSYEQEYPRKPFLSNKNGGMGIGLFLTQASISRYGGTVTINSFNDAAGSLTTVKLPLFND